MRPIERILVLLFLFAGATIMAQRNLNILFQDKTIVSKPVTTIQSITFSNGSMVVKNTSNLTDSYSTATIRNLKFGAPSGVNTTWASAADLTLFPNPAKSLLYLKNANESIGAVQIYGIDGAEVSAIAGEQIAKGIDVSALTPGIYFLKVNGKTLKFIKL